MGVIKVYELHLKRILKWDILITIAVILLSTLITSNVALANEEGLPFTVEPILPNNQSAETTSYISIQTDEAVLEQNIDFKLTNTSDQVQEINVKVVDAYTSPNGVIQYVSEASENSEIIHEAYKLTGYLKVAPDTIKLKPGETSTITMPIDVTNVEGVLLGGVSFSSVVEGTEIEENDSSFQINNEINMVIGVMLDFADDGDIDFKIEQPFIDPMPSYFAVRLPITLDAPALIQDATMTYDVLYKDDLLFSNEKKISFAPYSKTNISIPFEYDEIVEKTDYTIQGELIYQDQNNKQVKEGFHETFQYKKNADQSGIARIFNVPTEVGGIAIWIYFVALLGLVILLVIIVTQRKKSKTED